MPIGSNHTLTGLIVVGNRPGSYVLRCDDGGQWQLDLRPSHWRYAGQRVRIEGKRTGFDLLDVSKVESVF